MKSKIIFLLISVALLLSSCAEKVTVCTIHKEYVNGFLSGEYIFSNGKLQQYNQYDTTGTIIDWSFTITRNGSGAITSVLEFVGTDSLLCEDIVYMNTNGLIDSIAVHYDTDADNVPDSTGETWVYQYTGNDMSSVGYASPGNPFTPVQTYIWSNGNLVEVHNPSGSYSIYTYSAYKSPYHMVRTDFQAMYKVPVTLLSENAPNHRDRYNSSQVLIESYDYQHTVDGNNNIVSTYNTFTLNTNSYEYTCIEQ